MKAPQLFVPLFQVRKNEKCFRCNNGFVIVLPCPEVFTENALQCVSMLLMLAGDVEANPDPEIEKMLAKLLKEPQSLWVDIKQMKDSHALISKQLETFHQKLEQIQETLKNVTLNTAKIMQKEVPIQSVESTVRSQAQKLVDLEYRSRRNNLLVFGIPEGLNETEEDLKQKVLRDVLDKCLVLE